MADILPAFDVEQLAGDVRRALDQHRTSVGATVCAPSSEPMFRRAADGAVLDGAGREIRPAPLPAK